MKKDKQAYAELVKKLSPKSDMAKGVWRAFAVGGLICVIGQAINDVFSYGVKWGTQSAATATSICLVFLSALLTGLNLYNKLARFGGAGTLVPITGFANAVVSPAIDFKSED